MSFDAFLKKRKVSEIVEKMEESNKKGSSEFYYPVLEKETGNASVIIRFLPPTDDGLPYRTLYSHGFKGDNNQWVIADFCPTTIGKDCKICALNSQLWNLEVEKFKDVVRKRKRKKSFIFNILIVKDDKQPELEGKVMPFKIGQMIFDKVISAMKPAFPDEPAIDPFDLTNGHNFMLRIKRDKLRGEQITYDESKFAPTPSEIPENKLREIFEQMTDLNKYVDPSRMNSLEAVDKRLYGAYSDTFRDARLNINEILSGGNASPMARTDAAAAFPTKSDEIADIDFGPAFPSEDSDSMDDISAFFEEEAKK